MELIDALKTIEAHLRLGTAIGIWKMSNGQMARTAGWQRKERYVQTVEDLAKLIEEEKAISPEILHEYTLLQEGLSE